MKSLKDNQDGAIMMIGLFVALSLAASLWFLLGIGDAVVFHDRGQEAADSVALSAATIDARGMNTISALNIITLALVAFYLILCFVGDLLVLIATILVFIPIVQVAAVPVGRMAMVPYRAAKTYERTVLKKALPVLGTASTAVAVTAPWLGTIAGAESARHYKTSTGTFAGLALGPSNIPIYKKSGSDKATEEKPAKTGAAGFFDTGSHKVLGLPVEPEKNQAMCVRAVAYVVAPLTTWLRTAIPIPIIGPIIGTLIAQAIETLAVAPAWVHCAGGVDGVLPPPLAGPVEAFRKAVDIAGTIGLIPPVPFGDKDLWEKEGPKKTAYGNGEAHLLVLGWALSGDFRDDSSKIVKLASKDYSGGVESSSHHYDAQAEFYYDCGQLWPNVKCNGPAQIGMVDVGYQYTMYSVKWKARLKRSMHIAEVFARVGLEKALDYFTGKGYREAYLGLKDKPAADAFARYVNLMIKGTIKEGAAQGRFPTDNFH